jgi:predicted porin
MKKKLLAVAVGAALAVPAVAFAQSSVTISGKVMASFGQYKLSNRPAGSTGHSSETQVRDESSRVIFEMREDLGGGLAAIGKFDFRAGVDSGAGPANTGESFVGLSSRNWGTLTFGRHDLHYGKHASFTGVHGGLQTNPLGVFGRAAAYGANGAAVTNVAIANHTRSPDVVRYGSPKFANMFEIVVAYSASGSAAAAEADLRSANRKGSAWNLAPTIWGKNWEAGYSYWTAKPDTAGAAATTVKHRGDSLYGWYKWGGLRVGLAWDKSKIDTTTAAGVTTQTSNVTTWGIPISYNWGPHTIYGDFYRKRNDKATAAAGLDSKANFFGVTYAYDLSKRTTAALSYTRINNGANAAYNLFAGNAGLVAGEDPRSWHVTLQHRY